MCIRDRFPCDLVKEKALAFGLHPKLKGKIFLAGGLAPWVISGDEKEIESRFFAPLEFGTAGLRGTMCVGLHQMNIHVGEPLAKR